ncbi:MAG: hypothetical protein AAF743_12915 [Planctomycetota bacterium]
MALLITLTAGLAVAPLGPQGEVIRDNAQHKRQQGFYLVDGKWVRPQMHFDWSELVRFERTGGDVHVVAAMSEKTHERLRNNRRMLVTVGDARMPFQLDARRRWINGRHTSSSWLRLQAVAQPGDSGGDWQIEAFVVAEDQMTLTARRTLTDDADDKRVRMHVVSARRGTMMAAVTTDVDELRNHTNPVGRVMLHGPAADLTSLMIAREDASVDDPGVARRSWDVIALLTDDLAHPLRPLPGDFATASSHDTTAVAAVEALLPRMLDPSGTERNAASDALEALGPDAIPAVLQKLKGPLLPEQRRRLEGFIAHHTLYRDDNATPGQIAELRQR